MSSWPVKRPVLGAWPMAMNTPVTARVSLPEPSVALMRTPVTPLSSPTTSSTAWFQRMLTLPSATRAMSRSCRIFSLRSRSRRCTSVTCAVMFERYSASSTAVLPPPITATRWLRKKKPSQVAQADTPLPRKVSSEGRPRYLAAAPVAMISASQV